MCSSTTVTAPSVASIEDQSHVRRPAPDMLCLRRGLLSGGRALAERYLHGALVAVPLDREGDLVAGLLGVDCLAQCVARINRLAVDGGGLVAGLGPGRGGGSAVSNLFDRRGARIRQADPEERVLDVAVPDQLARDSLGRIAGGAGGGGPAAAPAA